MKKKPGVITYYIEIPIEVSYTWYPKEPWLPECIEVGCIKYPDDSEMIAILDKHAERIREVCFEDLEE